MSREDNIRWYKNVKNRGLDKVYRESDWLEFVKARDAAEQSGFVPSVHGCNEQLSWPVLNATENGGNYIVLSPPVEKPERPSNHWSFGWSDLRFYTVEKRTCGYLGNILVIPNTITVGGE
jgi:hypothetical protein